MKELTQFFRGFQKGMKNFGQNISVIVNSVLLAIVYLFGVGFTALFARLVNKHFLVTKRSKKKDTYWSTIKLKKKNISQYYRQF